VAAKASKGDVVNGREPEQELAGLHAAAVYDTAQFEEKQNNRPHATKLYRQIAEEYPDARYANQERNSKTADTA
jgi:hypothetical protein